MTTVLAIPISTAITIPKGVGDANIHNLQLVDNSVLITQIENQFMARQLFNDRSHLKYILISQSYQSSYEIGIDQSYKCLICCIGDTSK